MIALWICCMLCCVCVELYIMCNWNTIKFTVGRHQGRNLILLCVYVCVSNKDVRWRRRLVPYNKIVINNRRSPMRVQIFCCIVLIPVVIVRGLT
jgi:hypothetical protein